MGTRTVHIFADSTCDLSDDLISKYDITIIPLCIVLDDKSYYDKLEITPSQIYKWADQNNKTPKTAAVTVDMVYEKLRPHMEADEDVIFFGISEDMSTTCNVVRLVSNEFDTGRVFVINSKNLSTGMGLQVLRAAELVAQGSRAEDVVAEIEEARDTVRASFVVDTLTYLARGGRCSGATALVANTLRIHPCIRVDNGKMEVGKKYRGNIRRSLMNYLDDLKEELVRADKRRVFITHSGISQEILDEVNEYLISLDYFDQVHITRAGGVISSHCGPNTLGVLFYSK